jgi:hypothetical protein
VVDPKPPIGLGSFRKGFACPRLLGRAEVAWRPSPEAPGPFFVVSHENSKDLGNFLAFQAPLSGTH